MEDLELLLQKTTQENLTDLLKRIELIGDTKSNEDINKLIDLLKRETFPENLTREMIKKIRLTAIKVTGNLEEKSAVPTLIKYLKSKNPMIKNAAAIALGKLKEEEALEELFDTLGDDNTKVEAIKAMGEIESNKSLKRLITILKEDRDLDARSSSAVSLGKIGDPAAVEDLSIALEQDPEVNVRRLSAIALGEIGDPKAVPVLIRKLNDQFMNVSTSAADSLIKIGVPAIKPLVEVIDNRLAADALIKIGEPSIEELINLLTHKDEKTREISAKCLGKMKNTKAVAALVKELNNNSGKCLKVMRDAIFFICKDSLKPLEEALTEDNNINHEAIVAMLFDIGHLTDNGPERLEKELETKNTLYQKLLIKTFGKLEYIKIYPLFKELFFSTHNTEIKKEILKAIKLIGPSDEILEISKKAVEIENDEIKELALYAIINTDSEEAIDIFKKFLKEGKENLKKISAEGLGQINNTLTVPPLIEALSFQDEQLKLIVITALGKKNDNTAKEKLIELLNDNNPEILLSTIKAIKNTGDREVAKNLKKLQKSPYEKIREEASNTLKEMGINSGGFWSIFFNR